MNKCFWCEQEAVHQFKNGRYCCNTLVARCPEVKRINSEKHTGENHPMYGKPRTEAQKLHHSKMMKGRAAWNKGLFKGVPTLEKFAGNEVISTNQSGVYAIRNLVTNKIYIGSAIDLLERRRIHLRDLMHGKHANRHLQSSFNLYGASNFDFRVIEFVNNSENLTEREQFWIDQFDLKADLFNMCKQAYSTIGRKHAEETKRKMSANRPSYKGEQNPFYGKKHSEETRRTISVKATGRKQSQASIKKGIETLRAKHGHHPNSKPVNQIDPKTGEVIKTWENMTEAATVIGTKVSNISVVCNKTPVFHKSKGRSYITKTAGGYGWEFA